MTNHPHNNFFEKVFSMLDITRDFLEQIPPKEIREMLDLSVLELVDKTHINEALRKTHSDLIFETQLKTKIPLRIAILIEHKSNPPVNPHAQIIHYISSIHQENIINKEPLIPVLPILFYHGNKKWKKQPFTKSFPGLPVSFHQFIPTFDYLLINLNDYSDELIEGLKPSFLKNALFILKHSSNEQYLLNNAGKIFSGVETIAGEERQQKLIATLTSYLSHLITINQENMNQVSEQLPVKAEKEFVSIWDGLILRGKEIGLKEGVEKGVEKGVEMTHLLEKIKLNLRLLVKFPTWSLEDIAEFSSSKVTFVKKVQNGFKGGNEKKARKTVMTFFKKYDKLEAPITKEIEALLAKYVPLFKNK